MANFTATTGIDNYTGDASDETVFFAPGTLQVGDSFDGDLGFNTLQLDGPLGAGTYNWDFSIVTVSNFSALAFNPDAGANPASTFMNAFFAAEQFGIGGLSTSFSVTGSALSTDAITVTLSASGVFSAENWIFTTWTLGDLLTINGSVDDDVITGSTEADVINGGAGNDVLDGGTSVDTLAGGAGDDTYIYDGADTLTEQANEGLDTVFSSVTGVTLAANLEDLQLLAAAGAGSATGNNLANTITGNASANTINGGAGADTLIGGAGNDLYIVDDAGDTVTEGAAAGTDTVESSVTFTLSANVENLTLTGAGNINGTGNALNNTLIGNSGNNTLDGSTGADAMSGLGGNDTYIVDNAGDTVSEAGGGGVDLVQSSVTFALGVDVDNLTLTGLGVINGTGNDGNNTITGNDQANTLNGGADASGLGDDIINGMGGADTLHGGAGLDQLFGGDGDDVMMFNSAPHIVAGETYDGGAGTDTLRGDHANNHDFRTTTVLSIEQLVLGNLGLPSQMSFNWSQVGAGGLSTTLALDAMNTSGGVNFYRTAAGTTDLSTFTFSNWGSAFINVFGSADADTVIGSAQSDTISGNDGADNLQGAGGVDSLTGGAGDDTLDGGAGADSMAGGLGNDTYVVDNAGDTASEAGGDGTDLVQSSVTFALGAGVDNLTLTGVGNINGTGNGDANTITGNSGNNTLDGGAGIDTLIGGAGDDTYIIADADTVTELAAGGTDNVQASISHTLASEVENLTLTGVGNINGTGNSGANTITGNAGDNTLDGAAGADAMLGLGGNDTYVVDNLGDTASEAGGGGTDTVNSSVSFTLGADIENLTLTGVGNINGTGNSGANTITGNAGNNTIEGGAGVDTLSGGAGDDTLQVLLNPHGLSGESYDGGADTDTLLLGEGNDFRGASFTSIERLSFVGTPNTSLFDAEDFGGAGFSDNLVVTSPGTTPTLQLFRSGAGTTTLAGWTFSGTVQIELTGSAGADTLTGSSLGDTINGGAGADTINGGGGIDTLIGGADDDTYIIADADTITELAAGGTDTVQASISYTLASEVENLVLTGVADINGTGNTLANSITGNSGANTIDGGAGADAMAGGAGNDTYIVDNASDAVTELASGGTDLVQSSVDHTLASEVENLTLTGAAISGTGNSLANTIIGTSGNNTIDGAGGADSMIGGAGDDTYLVDNASDAVTEIAGGGSDTVNASVSYTLASEVESLVLTGVAAISGTGNALGNSITGNTAANVIDGGAGADAMAGGAGDDTYIVDNASDSVTELGGGGTDSVQSSVTHTLASEVENLTLTGSGNINGAGNSLANTITGNSGNNTLDGGAGADAMSGGLGDDTYVVDNAGDTVSEAGGGGADLVQSSVSFTLGAGVDNLTLTGLAAIDGTGNDLANAITGNSAANTIIGGLGNDVLIGGDGDDIIQDYGGGIGSIDAGIGNDRIFIQDLTGTIDGGAGSDSVAVYDSTFVGTAILDAGLTFLNIEILETSGHPVYATAAQFESFDTITWAVGGSFFFPVTLGLTAAGAANLADELLGRNASFTGSSGDDALTTSNGSDTLFGLLGNDVLDGGTGADSMSGGGGDDIYVIDNAGDTASEAGGSGTDLVQSSVSFALGTDLENLTLTGTSDINGTGNGLANSITGNSGANIIDGGAGADAMAGGAGNDTYIVDNASDAVTELASGGTDLVQSSVSHTLASEVENLTLTGVAAISGTGNSLANNITGNSAANTLDGGAGIDTLIGGAGDDTYVIADGDTITELASGGTDLVQASISYTLGSEVENLTLTGVGDINGTGNSGDNVINGNSGNNTLDGGAGTDTLAGGAGDDTYIINDGDSVSEFSGEGTDTVQSSLSYLLGVEVENLTLTGAADINGTGNSLNNVITGNTGNNTLDGGAGIDTLIGGAGNDTYVVDATGDAITENAGEGTDNVQASASYTLSAEIENLTLTGVAAISGTGNSLANTITGNSADNALDGAGGDDLLFGAAGADALVGGLGTDTASYVGSAAVNVNLAANVATGGDAAGDTFSSVENVIGSSNNDTLTGDSAANSLDGGAGADAMAGGAGDDTFIVDNAGDTASENASEGTDTVRSAVTFVLGANIENLVLTGVANVNGTGNALANTLTGNAGNNVLDGGTGVDTMIGGAGDDTYHANVIGDIVTELLGGGTDHVIAAGFYTLSANVENLTLTGVGATSGTGNTLDNVIIGNGAANILTGLAGNDTLNGGAGADQLYGGEGDDLYIVDNASDFTFEGNIAWGTDTVQASVTYSLGQNVDNLILLTGVTNGTGNNIANVITGNTLANTLFGLGGNDTLNGGLGADQMYAGEGDDTYFVDNAGDVAFEAQVAWGTDTVISSVTYSISTNIDNLTLAAGAGAINGNGNALNNVVTGNESANTLFGFLGNDTLNGGVGADQMYGGEGDDAYVVDNAGDIVFESSAAWGTDTVTSSVNYTLTTNIDNLVLASGATIGQGNNTANTITGNSAANTLRGFGGNDVLNGGAGNDLLNGGAGDDTFVFAPGTGQDRVADFVAGGVDDTLDLSAYNGSGVTWTISQVGADTVFTFTNGEEITLTGVTATNLVVIDPFHYG